MDEVILQRAGHAAGFHHHGRDAARIQAAEFVRSAALVAVLAGTLALAGCAARHVSPPRASEEQLSRFKPFLVSGSFEPFRARGAAQFTYRGGTESGELSLQAEPGPLYRIQIHARVSGSLALDLRFDAGDLLIVDYVHESYLLGGNTPETRQELFSLDMNTLDFQIALTARVPDELFQRVHGQMLPKEARFHVGDDEYVFTLDVSGLPLEWTKLTKGVPAFRVEYRSFLEIPAGQGLPIRMPERIRVYGPEALPRLILGIREWLIGPDPNAAPITFIPPQEVLERFRPQ